MAATCPEPPLSHPLCSGGFLGEDLRHLSDAFVTDPHCHEGRGVGIPGQVFCLEESSCDLLRELAAELADDGVDGLDDPKLLVVDLEVCLFVLESVDVVVVLGLLGSFHPGTSDRSRPPITGQAACRDEHPRLIRSPQDLFRVRERRAVAATCGGWPTPAGVLGGCRTAGDRCCRCDPVVRGPDVAPMWPRLVRSRPVADAIGAPVLLKRVAACHDLSMPEVSGTSLRQALGRRRTVWWVLGLVLALVLGAVAAGTIEVRERSPLASRPLLIRTLDRPVLLAADRPYDRFDPPPAGERAGVPAAATYQAWLRRTRDSNDDALPSSTPVLFTLAWWSRPLPPPLGSPGRLVWLFQLTSVPCLMGGGLSRPDRRCRPLTAMGATSTGCSTRTPVPRWGKRRAPLPVMWRCNRCERAWKAGPVPSSRA